MAQGVGRGIASLFRDCSTRRGNFALYSTFFIFFYILLTLHLSIFISVFNQLDAQNLFHNKFYFMPLHVSSTCAHHQEVKIALHSLWYHHTKTSEWSKITKYNSINMSKL